MTVLYIFVRGNGYMKYSYVDEFKRRLILIYLMTFLIIFLSANFQYVNMVRNDLELYKEEIVKHKLYLSAHLYTQDITIPFVSSFDILKNSLLSQSIPIYPQINSVVYRMKYTPAFEYYHFIVIPSIAVTLVLLIVYFALGVLLKQGMNRLELLKTFMELYLTRNKVEEGVHQRLLSNDDEIAQIAKNLRILMQQNCMQLQKTEILLQKMNHLAFHDSLTSLPNRKLFNDRLKQEIKRAKREGYIVAILFFDLNNFKHINDNFGHVIGDNILKEFAKRVQNVFRSSDTLARFGGDEFIAFLPYIDERKIDSIVEKIHKSLIPPYAQEGKNIDIKTAIGVSFYPEDAQDINELICLADGAMYNAKMQHLKYTTATKTI